MSNQPLLALVTVLVLGVSAQWLAWRVRAPSILFLLLFGILAGPIARAATPPDSAVHWLALRPDALLGELFTPVVSLSVAVILFEGGLSLKLAELRQVSGVVRNLLCVGVLLTWGLGTAGAYVFLELPFRMALLLGALLVVSGPTVIGPLLSQIRPTPRLASILKWEGILIDPVGVVLAALVFHAAFTAESSQIVWSLLWSVGVGVGIGGAAGLLLTFLFQRFWVPDFLHPAVALMFIGVSFTASNLLQEESGLVAVTLMGVLLANQRSFNVDHIIAFQESLRVLLLGSLFVVLAARIQLPNLVAAGLGSLAFLAFLILVVRPLAVAVSTLGSDLSRRERLFLAWVAPRGIVAASTASIFALYLQNSAPERGGDAVHMLPAVTFVVIIGTVTVYGLTAPLLARRLELSVPDPQGVVIVGSDGPAHMIAQVLHGQGVQVLLLDDHRGRITAARLQGLPTYLGSVHSERLLDEMDLTGMGRLLALSAHEAVNVLAIHRFRDVFGRAHVYQLSPDVPETSKVRPRDLPARPLFSPDLCYQSLEERLGAGAVLKATKLTEAFTFQEYQAHQNGRAMPFFILLADGRLRVIDAGQAVAPLPGQIVISLVDRSDASAGPPSASS